VEVGSSETSAVNYGSGAITNGVLVGLPCEFTPPYYEYPGYMRLQVECCSTWTTIDSWVVQGGGPTHTFSLTFNNPCGTGGTLSSGCEDPALFDKDSWGPNSQFALSPEYRDALNAAADLWNNVLKFKRVVSNTIKNTNPGWKGISLQTYYEVNNPNSTAIATCIPLQAFIINDNLKTQNTITFRLTINSALTQDKDLLQVMVHELGHALGIGFFWVPGQSNIPYIQIEHVLFLDGTQYTNAQAAYNQLFSFNKNKIPLEEPGAHWQDTSETIFSGTEQQDDYEGLIDSDIMCAIYNNFFDTSDPSDSPVTLGALVDMGYELK
jgi:hypothetical protein